MKKGCEYCEELIEDVCEMYISQCMSSHITKEKIKYYESMMSCQKHCDLCNMLKHRIVPTCCYLHSDENSDQDNKYTNIGELLNSKGYYLPNQFKEYYIMKSVEFEYESKIMNNYGQKRTVPSEYKCHLLNDQEYLDMYESMNGRVKKIKQKVYNEKRLLNAKKYYEENKEEVKRKRRERYHKKK